MPSRSFTQREMSNGIQTACGHSSRQTSCGCSLISGFHANLFNRLREKVLAQASRRLRKSASIEIAAVWTLESGPTRNYRQVPVILSSPSRSGPAAQCRPEKRRKPQPRGGTKSRSATQRFRESCVHTTRVAKQRQRAEMASDQSSCMHQQDPEELSKPQRCALRTPREQTRSASSRNGRHRASILAVFASCLLMSCTK